MHWRALFHWQPLTCNCHLCLSLSVSKGKAVVEGACATPSPHSSLSFTTSCLMRRTCWQAPNTLVRQYLCPNKQCTCHPVWMLAYILSISFFLFLCLAEVFIVISFTENVLLVGTNLSGSMKRKEAFVLCKVAFWLDEKSFILFFLGSECCRFIKNKWELTKSQTQPLQEHN